MHLGEQRKDRRRLIKTRDRARPHPGRLLQRKCACGQHTIAGGECESCRKKAAASTTTAVQGQGILKAPGSGFGHEIGRATLSRDDSMALKPGRLSTTGSAPMVQRINWGEAWDALVGVGPIDAYKAKQLADRALQAAQNTGLPGLHNGPADAWRHCYWNCTMTGALGADQARTIADNHERHGGGPANENSMDQHNNAEGRACGGSSCDSCCQGRLDSGALQVIDAAGNIVPSSATPRGGGQQPDSSYSSEYYSNPPSGGGVDWSRKGCCFTARVPVATSDGQKSIGSVSAGDQVLAYNPETGEAEYREVLEVQIHEGEFPVLDLDFADEVIEVTTRHRFGLAGGSWVSSEFIQPQTKLQSAHSTAIVQQVGAPVRWQGSVYNLKVDGGNYYVGNNLVLVRDY